MVSRLSASAKTFSSIKPRLCNTWPDKYVCIDPIACNSQNLKLSRRLIWNCSNLSFIYGDLEPSRSEKNDETI